MDERQELMELRRLAALEAKAGVKPSEYGFGRSVLQGASFGFADEIEARLKGGDYSKNLAAIQAGKAAYEKENPWSAIAGDALGSLVTLPVGGALAAIPKVGKVVSAVTAGMSPLKAKLAASAATGAAYGGVGGAGRAKEDERLQGAGIGAATGAVLSPVASLAGSAVSGTAQRVVDKSADVPVIGSAIKNTVGRLPGVTTDFDRRSDVKLLQALKRDGMTPDAVAGNIASRVIDPRVLGDKPETIVNAAGRNTLSLADIASKYPGEARNLAGDLVERRMEGQASRISSDLGKAFKVDGDPVAVAKKLADKRAADAAPIYARVYESGQNIADNRIDDLLTLPAFQDAYKIAQRLSRYEGVQLPSIDKLHPGQSFSMRQLDLIKRGLDDHLYNAKAPTAGIGKTERDLIQTARHQFVDVLDELVPDYKAARAAYAGPTRMMEALEDGVDFGKKFSSMSVSEARQTLQALPPAEREQFLVGALNSLRTGMSKSADGRDAVKTIFGSSEKRALLREAVGDDAFNGLASQMVREKGIRSMDDRMRGNSQTMERKIAADDFDADTGLAQNVIDKGPVRGLTDYVIRSATGPGQPTADALGPKIFNTDVGQQMEILRRLRALDDTLRQQAITGGLLQGGAAGTGGGYLPGLLGN